MKDSTNKKAEEATILLGDIELTSTDIIEIIRIKEMMPIIAREKIEHEKLKSIQISMETLRDKISGFRDKEGLKREEDYLNYVKKRGITVELHEKEILKKLKIEKFKEERWGNRFNSLYLKNKDQFDQYTYKFLGLENGNAMKEVYFRLKDGEETWETMAEQFKKGRQESIDIIRGPMEARHMEENLVNSLKKAGVGIIIGPITLKNIVAVVELVKIKPSPVDEKMKRVILDKEYENWLQNECNQSLKNLTYKQ